MEKRTLKLPAIGFGKYGVIVLSIALFVVLDAGVLLLNFYTSYQVAENAHAIKVVSHQTTLSQHILKGLYKVKDDLEQGDENYSQSVDKMAASFRTFDEALDTMIYGGEMIGRDQGQDALFTNKEYREAAEEQLASVQDIWQIYRQKIGPVANSYYAIEINETLDKAGLLALTKEAVEYGSRVNEEFLAKLHSITATTEQIAQNKALRLRRIQVAGISLALINFFIILLHFIRRLQKSDRVAEEARKETDEILANVGEGLFLIDKNYIMGTQSSTSLKHLLRREEFTGDNFLDLMQPLLSKKDMEILKDYIEILMSDHVKEGLVKDLNPLDEIEIAFDNNDGSMTTRYLSFNFSRVLDKEKQLRHLLATVRDVTDAVNLRKALLRAEKNSKQEIEVMLSILHVDRAVMADFMRDSMQGLEEINLILKKQEKGQSKLKQKLNDIGRLAHKVKGECSAISLHTYEERMHLFEERLADAKEKIPLQGSDFIPITAELHSIMQDWDVLKAIYARLSALGEENDSLALKQSEEKTLAENNSASFLPSIHAQPFEPLLLRKVLQSLIHDVSRHYQKQVAFSINHFDTSIVPVELRETIKTFIIQFVRNAVAHGIETPEQRRVKNKLPTGSIDVYIKRKKDDLFIGVRDDGAGLNINNIKQTAIEKGLWTEAQARNASKKEIIDMIFSEDFTTLNKVTAYAGRGVGLDLVKSSIEEVGGFIDVGSKVDAYTEFRVKIPMEQHELIGAELA